MRAFNYLSLLWQKPPVLARAVAAISAARLWRRPVLRGAELAVTYRCQAVCPKCSIANLSDTQRPELTPADITTIAADIRSLGGILIDITGGEPLLRPDIIDIVRIIGALPVIASMATNALELNLPLCRQLRQAGLQVFQFSVVSPIAEEHDRELGVSGSFAHTMEQIAHARQCGMHVLLNTVVTRDILHSHRMRGLIDLARKNRCLLSLILPAPVGGWQNKDVMLTAADHAALRQWLRYPFVTTDTETCYAPGGCPAGGEKIYISAYGDLFACPFIQHSHGNVRQRPLPELWAAMRAQRYARCVNIKPSDDSDARTAN